MCDAILLAPIRFSQVGHGRVVGKLCSIVAGLPWDSGARVANCNPAHDAVGGLGDLVSRAGGSHRGVQHICISDLTFAIFNNIQHVQYDKIAWSYWYQQSRHTPTSSRFRNRYQGFEVILFIGRRLVDINLLCICYFTNGCILKYKCKIVCISSARDPVLLALPYWGRDKMAAIFQTTFKCIFLNYNFIVNCS